MKRAWCGAGMVGLLACVALSGCGATRPVSTPAEMDEERLRWIEKYRGEMDEFVGRLAARMKLEYDRCQQDPTLARATYDVLILSGGGDYGAFGAGFLAGWGTVTDQEFARPRFDLVTGISTGALMAPFAFVGTDESYAELLHLYTHPKDDWVHNTDFLFFLPWRESLMDVSSLRKDIGEKINAEMVEKMAAAADDGRVLGVAATNLDLGVMRAWDIGMESQKVRAGGDIENIHKYLFASSAIPGAFPPVEIENYLYSDGGVIANLVYDPDVRNEKNDLGTFRVKYPGVPLPKVRLWVIINNELLAAPRRVVPQWSRVVERSLEISIQASVMSTLRRMALVVERAKAEGADIEFRYVAIPDAWVAPVEGTFKKETMESLAAMGEKMGADPKSWLQKEPQPVLLRALEHEFGAGGGKAK